MNDTAPLVTGPRASATTAILVIDDQLLVSSALAHTLQGLGFDAHAIRAEVAEVQAASLAHLPGIILLDLDLGSAPDCQPFDAVHLIDPLRSQGWTVMVITGTASPDRIAQAASHGAASWILKGSTFAELVNAVVEMMQGHEQAKADGRGWPQPTLTPVQPDGELKTVVPVNGSFPGAGPL